MFHVLMVQKPKKFPKGLVTESRDFRLGDWYNCVNLM